jgi:hypothetical protein
LLLSDIILVHRLGNDNLPLWLALGWLFSFLSGLYDSDFGDVIIVAKLFFSQFFALVLHQDLEGSIILICYWVEDLALLGSGDLGHTLSTKLKEWDLATTEVESGLSIE